MRPRVIRQIYKDPMTESGEWSFVYNVPTSPSGNNEGLPIVGLRSKSNRDSIKVYGGKSLYSDWEFSALNPLLGGPPPGQPHGGASQPFNRQNATKAPAGGGSDGEPGKQ